jgi:integrase/recombinase XerD
MRSAPVSPAGYERATIRTKLDAVTALSHWMATAHVAVADLDERRVDAFLDARRRRCRRCRGVRTTLGLLLAQLRAEGAIPPPVLAGDDTPVAAVLIDYEGYLRRERALAATTIAGYLPFVRALVAERLADGAADLAGLRPGEVRDFLLIRLRRMAPKRA